MEQYRWHWGRRWVRRRCVTPTFLFNLDGVKVWDGVSRASRGAGGATDWELLQVFYNKDWWSKIKWYKDGKAVANPFE